MPCPTCGSPDPKRHPAVQWEGEVQPCSDAWHSPPRAEVKRAVARLDALAEELRSICSVVTIEDLKTLEHHERQLVLLLEGAASQYLDAKQKRAGG